MILRVPLDLNFPHPVSDSHFLWVELWSSLFLWTASTPGKILQKITMDTVLILRIPLNFLCFSSSGVEPLPHEKAGARGRSQSFSILASPHLK